MTITEKILAAHCGKDEVSAGELINAKLDVILANDITAPMQKMFLTRIKSLLYLITLHLRKILRQLSSAKC
jgi:homoaconitase/3-isopropylmalate dehydratase large subunit